VRAEAAFFDRFVELTRGITSVLISHRFSSVRRADRIVVLDAGRIVEQGSHVELMALDGYYAQLFRLQAERFAAGMDADGNHVDPATPMNHPYSSSSEGLAS
jgi:ATP-binding cassette subfamily B protein